MTADEKISRPDFAGAQAYALQRLERELPPGLYYHSLAHTRDEVTPAALRLAEMEGVSEEELLLLHTACLYHDLGFVVQRADHEAVSARVASEVLPHFGYSPEQITVICGLIMTTRLPQAPHTLLEQIIADADLDSLGREDGIRRGDDLRAEMAADGTTFSDVDWYRLQLDFYNNHSYFTESARALRQSGKETNIRKLEQLYAAARSDLQRKQRLARAGMMTGMLLLLLVIVWVLVDGTR